MTCSNNQTFHQSMSEFYKDPVFGEHSGNVMTNLNSWENSDNWETS